MVTARKKIQEFAGDKISPYRTSAKKNLAKNIIEKKSNNYLYGLLLLYLVVIFLLLLR